MFTPSRTLTTAIVAIAVCSPTSVAIAQIIPDNTLSPAEQSQVFPIPDPNFSIDLILGGATRGTSLLHSFEAFNVGNNAFVYFTNPAGIETILSRVTGNTPSNILGTLGVLGTADLFLVNPNGIVFGENAQLDVAGSFVATTADSVLFNNNQFFSARNPSAPPLLTLNVPLGLQYGNQPPQEITVQGSRLFVNEGQSLILAGGEVAVDNSLLATNQAGAGGRIELAGIGGAGVVNFTTAPGQPLGLQIPDTIPRADIAIANSFINVSTGNGGSFAATGNRLNISDSFIVAGINDGLDFAGAQSGDIRLRATDAVQLDSALIVNNIGSGARGAAGDIAVEAGSLRLTNNSLIGSRLRGTGTSSPIRITTEGLIQVDSSTISSDIEATGRGRGGGIQIDADRVSLLNGGQISTSTAGQGHAGSVKVEADNDIRISGANAIGLSSSISSFVTPDNTGTGNSGNVVLEARSLSLTNGALLSTNTFGRGNAGNLTLDIDGAVWVEDSTIRSGVSGTAQGNGGTLRVNAGTLRVRDSTLGAPTFGNGDAGRVILDIDGAAVFEGLAGIFNPTIGTTAGQGGDVRLQAGSLQLLDGALLLTSTQSSGDAGDMRIDVAGDIQIRGIGSSISTSVLPALLNLPEGQGDGGNLRIQARSLTISEGGIDLDTFGQGDAGDLFLTITDQLRLEQGGSISTSVQPEATGNGGNIQARLGSLSILDGSTITTVTEGNGNSGNIVLNVAGDVTIANPGFVTIEDINLAISPGILTGVARTGVGDSGKIQLTARSLNLDNFALISSSTIGRGNVGDIDLTIRDRILLDRSSAIETIVGAGAVGTAGDIRVRSRSLTLAGGSQLQTILTRQFQTLPGGQGQAGDIDIVTDEFITIEGTSKTQFLIPVNISSPFLFSDVTDDPNYEPDFDVDLLEFRSSEGFSSGLFSSAERGTVGAAGDIRLRTGTLHVRDGGIINALTTNAQNAGNISIEAQNLNLTGGGQIVSATRSAGNAGNVDVNVADQILLSGRDATFAARLARFGGDVVNNQGAQSGIFANTSVGSTGNGGSIRIDPDFVLIQDGAGIGVNSEGTGQGGSIFLDAGRLTLDNQGFISAATQSSQGGNIVLDLDGILLMRNNSLISATAGLAGGAGNGGNIDINADFVIGVRGENSDIIANAFEGAGGNINITTQQILGLEFRDQLTPLSDITASSEFGLDGTVQISELAVDPSQGLTALTTEFADPAGLIDRSCDITAQTRLSEFTVTGRGGLPPAPSDRIDPAQFLEDLGGDRAGGDGNLTTTTRELSFDDSPIQIQRQSAAAQPDDKLLTQAPDAEMRYVTCASDSL